MGAVRGYLAGSWEQLGVTSTTGETGVTRLAGGRGGRRGLLVSIIFENFLLHAVPSTCNLLFLLLLHLGSDAHRYQLLPSSE